MGYVISILGGTVSAGFFLMVFVVLLVVSFFVYKEWPEFKKRMSGGVKSENEVHTVEERINRLEKRVDEVYDMLSRDYRRLNEIEKIAHGAAGAIQESLAERQIIMDALLGCLKALQELGAGGATRTAIDAINSYLNRQAHVNQEVLRL